MAKLKCCGRKFKDEKALNMHRKSKHKDQVYGQRFSFTGAYFASLFGCLSAALLVAVAMTVQIPGKAGEVQKSVQRTLARF